MMLDARGNLVELFGNTKSGTWTMVITTPGGPTCILTTGENYALDNRIEHKGKCS